MAHNKYPTLRAYGAMTWLEKLHMVFTLVPLPLVLLTRLLTSPFSSLTKHKSIGRLIADTSFRYCSSSLSVNQTQGLLGTDEDVYAKWCKKHKVKQNIEKLKGGGSDEPALMWLSEKREGMKKVVLYLHGGCYCLPMQDFAADYWKKLIDSIKASSTTPVGLVALKYSLIPNASFPTPLTQIIAALQHLLVPSFSGLNLKPENIHIAGESAGGGLVLQLLSHMLHPYPGVSHVTLSAFVPRTSEGQSAAEVEKPKLGSLCIMSPISSLTSTSPSFTSNSDYDVLPTSSWSELCSYSHPALERHPESEPYLEPVKAPEGWWKGAKEVVGRVWMSVGEWECLRDDVLGVVEAVKRDNVEGEEEWLTTFTEPKGVHNSQYLDLMAGEEGELGKRIGKWVEESLRL